MTKPVRCPPPSAVRFSDRQPGPYEYVLGWISDDDVAIENWPAVIWRDNAGQWWTGVPGKYFRLTESGWSIEAWIPFAELANTGPSDA